MSPEGRNKKETEEREKANEKEEILAVKEYNS